MRKEVKVVMKSFKKETKNLTKKTTDNINFEVSKGFLKRNKRDRTIRSHINVKHRNIKTNEVNPWQKMITVTWCSKY